MARRSLTYARLSWVFVMMLAASIWTSESLSQQAASTPPAVNPEIWPQVRSPLPSDPALEAFVADVLSRMTVEEKVAQIIQADASAIEPGDLLQYPLGAVLNGADYAPGGNDKAPAREWLAYADAYYDAMKRRDGTYVPLLWGTDAVHGHNNIPGATIFPHNIGLGAARDAELVRQIGRVTAIEMAIVGEDWTFAPTVAVTRDERWGRTYESYGEDPQLVAAYAAALVEGLQGVAGTPLFLTDGRVLATAKHFIGDGGTAGGTDRGDTLAAEAELRDIHGAGYVGALQAGVQTIMVSYSSWQGTRVLANKALLTDVLKGRMGFDGFLIGDWNGHALVPGCSRQSCPAAINNGLDMFMAPHDWRELYANTLAQVQFGEIPMARLDDAVRRILRVKVRAGLFQKGRPSERPFAARYDLLASPEHRALARRAVRASLVLLKNNGRLLPLARNLRVLVAGDSANNISKQSGGWTLSWQGWGNSNADFPQGQSIYDGIREAVERSGGTALLSPSGSYGKSPDVAIVVFGEEPYAEGQGDRTTLDYDANLRGDLTLLRKLKAAGIPTVSVFLSGRPLWVNPEINASDAFVAAWLPGTEGGGIADVLFRKPSGAIAYAFSGKLPFSWPSDPQATRRDDPDHKPLFPYGYGLTYADDVEIGDLSED